MKTRTSPAARTVRVSLVDGRILPEDEKPADANKAPVRPWVGADHFSDNSPRTRESYVPSADPVRSEGRFSATPAGSAKP
jgi:hypothetical protein